MESLVEETAEPLLVVILGPTGSGKTSLSVALGQRFDGEIVSCDSVAVYRGLEIGSAKPSVEQRRLIPHHLLDVVDPDAFYTAGDYSRAARETIADIVGRAGFLLSPGAQGSIFGLCCKACFPVRNGRRRCAIACCAGRKRGARSLCTGSSDALTQPQAHASTPTIRQRSYEPSRLPWPLRVPCPRPGRKGGKR